MKKEKLITDPTLTGDRIKRLRNNDYKTRPGKMSQPELAEKIHCSDQTVRRYENGRCGSLDIQTIDLLAKTLNTNVGFLIGKISDPAPMDSWETFAKFAEADERLAEREEILEYYRQTLSGMFEYFNYRLKLPTLDEIYGEPITTRNKCFAGFVSKLKVVEIYPYSDPSRMISIKLSVFQDLMNEMKDFLEFRLYKLSKLYEVERETPEEEGGNSDE